MRNHDYNKRKETVMKKEILTKNEMYTIYGGYFGNSPISAMDRTDYAAATYARPVTTHALKKWIRSWFGW